MKIELEHPVKHLLLDLDGTLLGNRSFRLSVDFLGKTLSHFKSRFGSWKKGVATLLDIQREFGKTSPDLTNDVRVINAFSKRTNLPFEESRKALREAVLLIFPGLEKHFYPMPGANDFINWAKDRYPMTLATNPVWPTEIVELRLKWAGIEPSVFTRITDIRSMHACKPAPEYYREILEHQKLEPRDALLIGNELKMDLPAVEVGIPVFIVGDYKTIGRLEYPGGKARAWRGKFEDIRAALGG